MKFSYTILPEKRLSVLYFRGSASVRDLVRAARQLAHDSRFDPAYNGIACLTGVTTRAKVEELRELLELLESYRSGAGAWAGIFTEPRTAALALIFKAAFTGALRIEVVASWEAACEFLRIEIPAKLRRPPRQSSSREAGGR